jgi:hypothetical protein
MPAWWHARKQRLPPEPPRKSDQAGSRGLACSQFPSVWTPNWTVNGELRQDGRTSDFLFDIPQLIEYITAFATLERGDVVMTGTPPASAPWR